MQGQDLKPLILLLSVLLLCDLGQVMNISGPPFPIDNRLALS